MSRRTFGSDVAQDNTTQGLEYPGYTSAGKEDKLMYQSPLTVRVSQGFLGLFAFPKLFRVFRALSDYMFSK